MHVQGKAWTEKTPEELKFTPQADPKPKGRLQHQKTKPTPKTKTR